METFNYSSLLTNELLQQHHLLQERPSNFSNQSVPIRRRFPQFPWFNDTGIPESCSVPEVAPVDGNRFIVPINGGLVPSLVFVTLVTNSLVCAVLLRKNMRTPTNTLLVAMAVSDTLTGIWSVPFFVQLYTLGGYANPLGYRWCRLYYWMTDYLPTVFHTASVWLTVALATERYIQVCHMLVAKNICTIRNMIRVIAIVYAAAILVHLMRFFEYQVFPLPVSKSARRVQRPDGTPMIAVVKTTTCCFDYVPPFSDNISLYFNVYFWCRVVLVNVIPCVSLTLLNARLAGAMREARLLRSRLVRQHRMTEYRRLGEANATTLMLLVVVSMFLVVEVPTGINLITLIVENNSGQAHVERWIRSLFELVTNLLIVFSYPLNFFIYCAMSRQFRQTFRTMFVAGCLRGRSTSTSNGQGSGSTAAGCGSLCPPSTAVHDEVRAGITPSASNVVDVRIEVK